MTSCLAPGALGTTRPTPAAWTRLSTAVLLLVAASAGAGTARAQTPAQKLSPFVVTAIRAPQPPEHVPFSLKTFDADALRATPALSLDGALRSVPGFSLFRRSDSLTANPSAQGVSLRGLGPSGASRSLIVLDGVPLNDPFGGWVAWMLVPRESLSRVELVRGGGAPAWGNAALGGVVQLFTAVPETAQRRLVLSGGDFSTRSAELEISQPAGAGIVQLFGRAFATDGIALVAPERRGSIDVAAASHHSWLAARWHVPLGENLTATITGRTFRETRNNGTPYQRNASRANLGSVALAGRPSTAFAWNAVGYAQDQLFSSTFSSVNATRTAETPASDQFAVPATAGGATWTGNWHHAGGGGTTAGLDARHVRGETREHFTFVNGAFTRLRVAGGTQDIGGVFALHEQPLAAGWRASLGVRLDRWRETDGLRRESDRATGTVSRADRYADRDGTEFSPSAGLIWQPAPAWRLRAAGQQAFRRPTLNELYRPFRQGANVTEANPALRTEHVTTGELAAEWAQPRGEPAGLSLNAAVFWNDLRDAVGNVTLVRGPGTFPLFGAIAAGGVGRQKLNLDRTEVRGLELGGTWRAGDSLSFNADALFNHATVRRASVAPALVGKRIVQVPRRSATLGATWRAPGGFIVTPRLRWIGAQFEDDENQLPLGEVVIVDLGISRPLTKNIELFLTAENLADARLETGRSVDGVVNIGTPRFLLGGVRGNW
ncbi:MAG: TonB-dependent receptor [Verrucomicrobia bacterium]|nr:TonB-dependent receptor [Verrucomicrobiota bacterium]